MKPISQTHSKTNKNTKLMEYENINKSTSLTNVIHEQLSSPRFETSLQLQFLTSENQRSYLPCNPTKYRQSQANQRKKQKMKIMNNMNQKFSLQNSTKNLFESTYELKTIPQTKLFDKVSMCEDCLSRFQQILGNLFEEISMIALDQKIMREQINIQLRTFLAFMVEDFQKIVSAQALFVHREKSPSYVGKDFEICKNLQVQPNSTSQTGKRQANPEKMKWNHQFTSSRSQFNDNSPISFDVHASFTDILKNSREHQLEANQRIEKIKKTINGLKRKLTKSTSITY